MAVCPDERSIYTINPKLQKLRSELEKNEKKIESLQSRNKDLRQQITALENTTIIGMVRDGGWTVDEVAQLLQQLKAQNAPNPITETEEETE